MSNNALPKNLEYLPEGIKSLLRDTIGSRLRLLISAKTPEKKRFENLEVVSGIPSATWRTWWRRDGTPSGQVIEAAAKAWPEHAFWLVTGITDVEAGHTMPIPPAIVKPYIDPFPETPFSAKWLNDFQLLSGEAVSWASTSAEPRGSPIGNKYFGKWPKGAYEFFEYTEQYLRQTLELKKLYWKDEKARNKKTPEMEIKNAERLLARKERWKNQLNKSELET